MPQYVIAVDLGGTQIRAALCDPSGQVFKRAARATKAQEGLEAVLARIALTIEEAAEGVAEESIAGIGIGAPGPLDPMTGTILAAPNLPGWINVPLRNLSARASASAPSSATTPTSPGWPRQSTAPHAASATWCI